MTRSSHFVDVDDSLGKGLRGLLRQIVPDAARDDPVRISGREFLGIRAGVRVWRPIGITFKRNGGYGDDWTLCKPPFEAVVFWLALSEAKPPARAGPRTAGAHPGVAERVRKAIKVGS